MGKLVHGGKVYANVNHGSGSGGSEVINQLAERVSSSSSRIVTSSDASTDRPGWCAFNGIHPTNLREPEANTCWFAASNDTNPYIQYDLLNSYRLSQVRIDCFSNYDGAWVGNIEVLGSTDGSSWTNILQTGASTYIEAALQSITSTVIDLNSTSYWRYIRIKGESAFDIPFAPSLFIDEIYIFGYIPTSNYTNTDYYTQSEQITDISNFTKLYSTESSVSYGSQGTRVDSALSITNESTLNSYMNEGWNSSHAAYYDSEDRIGAYAGYNFGAELPLKKIKLWLGRFSGQNKSLIATLQTLDGEGNWHDIKTLDISTSLPYPLNVFEIDVNRSCYGIRWIHSSGEQKNSGNNIIFFGMTIYKGTGDAERVFIPTEKVNYIPTGYSGFGTVVIDNDALINELYSFNQSQGGAWINTNADVSNLDYILFTYSGDPTAPDDRLMRQVLKSNIAVYTGGADVYTTIFTQAEIGLPLNVRIYNNILWVSFNGTGSNTRVVTVYNPITF